MVYKKSYLGLILWMIGFSALLTGCAFLPKMDMQITIAIVDNLCGIGIFILALIILLTESVYWYNGTSFQDALNAGSPRRKAFAFAHMIRFGIFEGAFFIYSIVSIILGIPYGVDIAVFTVGVIIAAISTIKIKL